MSELTAENQEYYDEDYFVKGSKRITDHNTGEEKVWGYKGTDWSGNYFILKGLMQVFGGELGSVIDIGAGQGSFTDYAIRTGLRARGYDFSKWAVAHPHNYAKGHLFRASATDIPEPDASYDMVFCSDMVEHIKKSEISKVVDEFMRITRKWVFLQFPVVTPDERFDAEKDGKEHRLYAHFMISGHLNMETREWWLKMFTDHGFTVRDDLVIKFRARTPREILANWKNVIILEK